jgi:ABC-type uncharacterized transport system fused permease/ATPase subunit
MFVFIDRSESQSTSQPTLGHASDLIWCDNWRFASCRIYPDSMAEMKAKGVTDEDLAKLLSLVSTATLTRQSNRQKTGKTGKTGAISPFLKRWNCFAWHQVDPPGIIVDRWSFDTEMNWSLTLSGGQKQR